MNEPLKELEELAIPVKEATDGALVEGSRPEMYFAPSRLVLPTALMGEKELTIMRVLSSAHDGELLEEPDVMSQADVDDFIMRQALGGLLKVKVSDE